jgi:hypothetical protein
MPEKRHGPPHRTEWHDRAMAFHHLSIGTNTTFVEVLSRNWLGHGCPTAQACSLGLHTISHLTKQIPPLFPSPSSPFQKNSFSACQSFLLATWAGGNRGMASHYGC